MLLSLLIWFAYDWLVVAGGMLAAANLSYDFYRPLAGKRPTDRELVRMTKLGIVLSWTLGYALAFTFDKLMTLWVFQATALTSTVLVPIFACLFWKGKKTPTACLLSFASGLVSVVAFYLTIKHFGEPNTIYGSYIWSFSLWGFDYQIWQEYSLFFTLPISVFGFLIENCFGSNYTPPASEDARR